MQVQDSQEDDVVIDQGLQSTDPPQPSPKRTVTFDTSSIPPEIALPPNDMDLQNNPNPLSGNKDLNVVSEPPMAEVPAGRTPRIRKPPPYLADYDCKT